MDLEYGRLNGSFDSGTLIDINGRKTVDEDMMDAEAVLVLQPIVEKDSSWCSNPSAETGGDGGERAEGPRRLAFQIYRFWTFLRTPSHPGTEHRVLARFLRSANYHRRYHLLIDVVKTSRIAFKTHHALSPAGEGSPQWTLLSQILLSPP